MLLPDLLGRAPLSETEENHMFLPTLFSITVNKKVVGRVKVERERTTNIVRDIPSSPPKDNTDSFSSEETETTIKMTETVEAASVGKRSTDFEVDANLLQLSTYLSCSPIVQAPSSKEMVLLVTEPRTSSRKEARPPQESTSAPHVSSSETLAKVFSQALQCDPILGTIVSQTQTIGKTIPNRKEQIQKKDKDKSNKKSNKKPKNITTQKKQGVASSTKIQDTQKKSLSVSPVKPQHSGGKSLQAVPLHLQADPFFGCFLAAKATALTTSKSTGNQPQLLSLSTQPKCKSNNSAAVLCSTAEEPSTYLEVEPLMCQLIPKSLADAINENLEKSRTPGIIHEVAHEDRNGKATDSKDWHALPKNLMGKVAFFEKLMKQKHEKRTVDPAFKVKAEVSEKVKSAHDQVRTSLTKVSRSGGKGVQLPEELTPLSKKKKRVETFFPKDEDPKPTVQPNAKQTSQWAKVEIAPPSSFEPSQEQMVSETTASSQALLSASQGSCVDDMVSKMAKNVDDELTSLDSELNNFDDKLLNVRIKYSEGADPGIGTIDKDAPVPTQHEKETKQAAGSHSVSCPGEKMPNSKVKHAADRKMLSLSSNKGAPQRQDEENNGADAEGSRTAASNNAEDEDEDAGELQEESIHKMFETGNAPPVVALSSQANATSDKVKITMEEPSASKVIKPDPHLVAQPAVSMEEVHGESLSRDLAAEVLNDEDDESDADPSAMDGFPSLDGHAPKNAKGPLTKLEKSYAQALAGGKKLNQPQANDIIAKILASHPEFAPASFRDNKDSSGVESAQGLYSKQKKASRIERSAGQERAKVEEMVQILADATRQHQSEQPAEESKSDADTDPDFTEIARRKKTSEVGNEVMGQSTPGTENEPFNTPTKANFNPYDALKDANDSSPAAGLGLGGNEQGKSHPKTKPIQPLPKRKKAVHFGGAAGKARSENGSRSITGEDVLNYTQSTPALFMPLHHLNNIAHKRPLSYIVDGIFWAVVLLVGGPVAAVGVAILTVYRILSFLLRNIGFGLIKPKKNNTQKLAVIVTGCDSGFGRDLASSLLKEGFVVFCGCLRKESMKDFEKEENAVPLLMDVTKDADVDKAAKKVSDWISAEEDRFLHALVNNAGVGTPGLADWLPLSEFQKMMDVNYFGMVRSCKKFFPIFKRQALKKIYADARIVNMVSMAGIVSGGLFAVGYEASKHAAEVFTTNLRLETNGLGLHVTVINPSFHRTPITKDMTANMKKTWQALTPEKRKEYGEGMFLFYSSLLCLLLCQILTCYFICLSFWRFVLLVSADYLEEACIASTVAQSIINWDSENVVEAMRRSCIYKSPPSRIVVGSNARYLLILAKMLPSWLTARLLTLKAPDIEPAMMKK